MEAMLPMILNGETIMFIRVPLEIARNAFDKPSKPVASKPTFPPIANGDMRDALEM